ncbi:MAG: EAL domain-containing protein [Snowella sp.]|nr:EAL domain-containing protein [Snowella sp.]
MVNMIDEYNEIINNTPFIQHILVIEDQAQRRTIILDEANYSLGRHSSNSIPMYSRQASRHHATLVRKFNNKTNQYSYLILDGDLEGNKSQNGIFINGQKCLIHELADGDLINFGCDVNASYHHLGRRDNGLMNAALNLAGDPNSESQTLDNSQGNNLIKSTLILSNEDTVNERDEDDTLEDQSYLDTITGLPNQTLFKEYLYIAISNAKRYHNCAAILLIDLDNLPQIYQSIGQEAGDRILKEAGNSIRKRLRNGDIVARWNETQFAILLPQMNDTQNLPNIVQRIILAIDQPITINQQTVKFYPHHAIASYPKEATDSVEILNLVEKRLTQVKLKEQSVATFTTGTTPDLQTPNRKERVERRLYRALEKGELALFYQPQVNLKTGEIEAMEAFVRWQHPQQGLVKPSQFLPWADQTELINPLSQWILQTACEQNRQWQQAGIPALVISVNLSAKQFYQDNFSNLVTEILKETGLEARWLELEITESLVLDNFEKAQTIIQSLRQLGVRFSLDDFGKHYASVRYLRELPVNKIKIDQSLIAKLAENSQETEIISALIDLGKIFHLQVVAEGVENQTQLATLQNLQCFLMQGYRFSQPMKSEDAKNFLLLHRSTSP